MGIKDLFPADGLSVLPVGSMEKHGKEVESSGHIDTRIEEKNRFVAHVDFATASNFARYGQVYK